MSPGGKPLFRFERVRYKEILDLPDLAIRGGIVTTLVGPSGSGKSTILKLLNKMASPTEGRILYDGEPLSAIPSVAHRRQVVTLTQQPAMFPGTVRDNLTAGLRFQQRPLPEAAALEDLLARIHLPKSLDNDAGELSGGEKQRLALGRALLLDTPVCLFDEPSSALDEETEHLVIEMLAAQARKKGKTIVMVTHSKAVADAYADEILEIRAGRLAGRR